MPEWPAFEIQSVKVKHMLWPHSVVGSLEGGVTSAIDPDFKRNRLPAGVVVRGQRLTDVWTHISLSQLISLQCAPNAEVLKDTRSLYYLCKMNVFLRLKCRPWHYRFFLTKHCSFIWFWKGTGLCVFQARAGYQFLLNEVESRLALKNLICVTVIALLCSVLIMRCNRDFVLYISTGSSWKQ